MFARHIFRSRKLVQGGNFRTRLQGEELEARWLPFRFHWSPLPDAADLDYHTAANWAKWNTNQNVWQRADERQLVHPVS